MPQSKASSLSAAGSDAGAGACTFEIGNTQGALRLIFSNRIRHYILRGGIAAAAIFRRQSAFRTVGSGNLESRCVWVLLGIFPFEGLPSGCEHLSLKLLDRYLCEGQYCLQSSAFSLRLNLLDQENINSDGAEKFSDLKGSERDARHSHGRGSGPCGPCGSSGKPAGIPDEARCSGTLGIFFFLC